MYKSRNATVNTNCKLGLPVDLITGFDRKKWFQFSTFLNHLKTVLDSPSADKFLKLGLRAFSQIFCKEIIPQNCLRVRLNEQHNVYVASHP